MFRERGTVEGVLGADQNRQLCRSGYENSSEIFPFGERSEFVWNPSDRHSQTPQKPERADESRTQTHRNQTARPIGRSGYCSQNKSTTQGKFIVLSIYLLDTSKM